MLSTQTQRIRTPISKLAVVFWILVIMESSRLIFEIVSEEENTNTSNSSLIISSYCPQISPLLGESVYQSK